jgi:hypothetical protein
MEMECITKDSSLQHSLDIFGDITGTELPIEIWRLILNHLNYEAIRLATVSKIFYHQIVFQSITTLSHLFNHSNKKYIQINLEDINDKFIQQFPNLEILEVELYGHNITDIGLNSLKNLTYLNIGNKEEFFEGMKELTNITYLDIQNNQTIKSISTLT